MMIIFYAGDRNLTESQSGHQPPPPNWPYWWSSEYDDVLDVVTTGR